MVTHVGSSRLQKLKNLAASEKKPILTLIDRYAYTGFLHRLSKSEWAEFFALKGGMMMLVLTGGNSPRPTKDIDLDGTKNMTTQELRDVISKILKIRVEPDDGLEFDTDTLDVIKDRTDNMISGAKVRISAKLGTAKIGVNIDVGFQNAITPSVRNVFMPSVFSDQSPIPIQMYPVETSIAEKFRAMVWYGKSNTRLKDYYDIAKYSELSEIEGHDLSEAIKRSFARMDMVLPDLSEIESLDEKNIQHFSPQWKAFTSKNNITASSFSDCLEQVNALLAPVILHIQGQPEPGKWVPHSGWSCLQKEPKIVI